jgi:hypothetical protein
MSTELGIGLLIGGAALAVGAALAGGRRLRPVSVAILAAGGACLGAGALLVQDRDVNAANWAATLVLAAALTPAHAWIVLGPPRAGARA